MAGATPPGICPARLMPEGRRMSPRLGTLPARTSLPANTKAVSGSRRSPTISLPSRTGNSSPRTTSRGSTTTTVVLPPSPAGTTLKLASAIWPKSSVVAPIAKLGPLPPVLKEMVTLRSVRTSLGSRTPSGRRLVPTRLRATRSRSAATRSSSVPVTVASPRLFTSKVRVPDLRPRVKRPEMAASVSAPLRSTASVTSESVNHSRPNGACQSPSIVRVTAMLLPLTSPLPVKTMVRPPRSTVIVSS